MLRATFVGHQSWLLSTARTHVLVDPLLTEGFGHGGLAGSVFPQRRFDFERMPKIDAVWLTHEHDDHFDLPSLMRLDRSVPIYASNRSSAALHGVLGDLGFAVHAVEPGAAVEIGALKVRTFVADHRATPLADEWDVLPFLVTDEKDEGAFASSVDVATPDALLAAATSMPARPWLLCLANNTTDVRFVRHGAGQVEPTDDTDALASVLARRIASCPRTPNVTAITGGGWSHPEDVAWIDRIAFCIDPDQLASSLGASCNARVSAVRPGDAFTMTDGGVQETSASWVTTVPGAARPDSRPVDVPDDVGPACGRRRAGHADWRRLDSGLRDLARYLFAREFFHAAFSSTTGHPLALILRDDAGDRTYAWTPSSAGFEQADVYQPTEVFSSGLRLWATDLLALFEGRLAPSAICYTGRVRSWNNEPATLRISPRMLWAFAHPLHRPEVARRLYDELVRKATREETTHGRAPHP